MRMRRKPYARPELAAWPRCIDEPAAFRGQWREAFDEIRPLRLELGCGKGGFIAQLGLREPSYNYLGVDIKSEVLVVAKRNIEKYYGEAKKSTGNIAIISQNIEAINTVLAPEDAVHRIYINFCNPWYKAGHAKHRLTHPRQLVKYRDFLVRDGEIWFKTDDEPLFTDTLRYLPLSGYEILWKTDDLHSEEPTWNIRTEHENMFAEQGIKIKACIARIRNVEVDKDTLLRARDI